MNAPKKLLFDDSLPALAKFVSERLGRDNLARGVVLRDTSGRLTFVAPIDSGAFPNAAEIKDNLEKYLGPYCRTNRAIIFSDEPGALPLLADTSRLPVRVGDLSCQLLDRRIVGASWLTSPNDEAQSPPRISFASVKGGVGRSTALAVAAADLARRNRNVLVVDIDLEAPGIGALLLDEDRTPSLGTADYLVENGLGGIPDSLLDEFIGTSGLTTGETGRVDVLPAFGRLATEKPENVLPKLSRAMIDDISGDGRLVSVETQIAEMVGRFAERSPYDVVFIDSRAGMSELAAPVLLGLGATILLFGTAQRQTIDGYKALFAALKLLAQRDLAAGTHAEWRLLFKAVYAKASFDDATAARHRDELYELFADYFYDTQEIGEVRPEEISFDIDDQAAPHWPLIIPFSQNFVDFEPVRTPSQLSTAFYESTFRPFLDGIDAIIASSASIPPSAAED